MLRKEFPIAVSTPRVRERLLRLLVDVFGSPLKLALSVVNLLGDLAREWKLQDRGVLLIVDEVRQLCDRVGHPESLVTWVELSMREAVEHVGIDRINIIFIASEQALVQSLMRYEGKTMICLMMRHLDYIALTALLEQFESIVPRDVTYSSLEDIHVK